MKKILSFMAIAMIMMGLSACSGGGGTSTPDAAVKSALIAMKSADVKALASVCCNSDGSPVDLNNEDPAEVKQLEMVLKMLSDMEYSIGSTNIDGDRAYVELNTKVLGHEKDHIVTCIKSSDGKWLVSLSDMM